MMLPTHALAGMLLALPIAVLAPEHATLAVSAGLTGGILPDLDMYVGHRKTLHFPVYYSVAAAVAVVGVLVAPTALTVAASALFVAAAVHSVADVFGGGLELRPWEATSDRGVYDHYRGRWIAPKRWIRYDGAPEDLLLSVGVAVPLWVLLDPSFRWVLLAALGVATVYTATRRHLPRIAHVLFGRLLPRYAPAFLLSLAPDRYSDGE